MVRPPHRFLGFAFACADLLIEVQGAEEICFAIGSAATLSGGHERDLVGQSWRTFVDERDQPVVEALFAGLVAGERQGPLLVRLAGGAGRQAFQISACRLAETASVISCALARTRAPAESSNGGLLDRGAFEALTKELIGAVRGGAPELELAFVEMTGLASTSRSLPSETANLLQKRLEGALRAQSYQGGGAVDLGPERFALLRAAGESVGALTARLARLLALVADTGDVKIAAHAMALGGDLAPAAILRAVRHAMDGFMRSGIEGLSGLSVSDVVNQSIQETLEKANSFSRVVAERQFKLVYQPVVLLKTGALHHHEVLVRFGDDSSPFPTIRMAEELDLIESLDLAVVEKVVAELKANSTFKLAVNVSGRTITSSNFIAGVERLVAGQGTLRHRLIFEITESAAIEDLALADRRIQSLRSLGCMVCLDDFGAGAASLAYLQQLTLDLVKIDGRYIRELQHGGRESRFIAQLARMCRELKVETLAEMVETPHAEEAVRQAGIDYAQGWLYGAASDRPAQPRAAPKMRPALQRAG